MRGLVIFLVGLICGAAVVFWLLWPLSAGLFWPYVCGSNLCK